MLCCVFFFFFFKLSTYAIFMYVSIGYFRCVFSFYDQPFVRVFFFFVFSCVLAYDLLLEALYHPLAHLIRIIFTFCVCVSLVAVFSLSCMCSKRTFVTHSTTHFTSWTQTQSPRGLFLFRCWFFFLFFFRFTLRCVCALLSKSCITHTQLIQRIDFAFLSLLSLVRVSFFSLWCCCCCCVVDAVVVVDFVVVVVAICNFHSPLATLLLLLLYTKSRQNLFFSLLLLLRMYQKCLKSNFFVFSVVFVKFHK